MRVVPNSLDPSLHGLDALCIPNLFANCLSTPPSHFSSFTGALVDGDIEVIEDHCDPALQNLVGDGADIIAHAWAVSGRIVDKLAVMEPFLRGAVRDIVRRILGVPPLRSDNGGGNGGAVSILQRMRDGQRINACRATVTEHESDRETESEDEGTHAWTAKFLFGVAGRSQIEGSQGMSQERIRSYGSDRRLLVEEGSNEDTSDPKIPAPLHASTPAVSECNSQQKFAKGSSRCGADSHLASLQTQVITSINTKDTWVMRLRDEHSSSRAVAHTLPLSPLSSPARNQPHSTIRHDPPLTDLQNIPLTRTKRAPLHLYSDPAKKRSKVEKAEEDPVMDSPRRKVAGPPGAAATEARKSTDVAPESGCTGQLGPDDEETRRSQRRALRARSRAIEEKLRHALVTEAR